MKTKHNEVALTSSELANLWVSYLNDTMAICGIKYFLANIQDEQIRSVLEYALKISQRHVQKVTKIFNEEDYPIPQGFTEKDVNLDAPRLFSDRMYLFYILNMGKFGLTSYALAISFAARTDIVQFYSTCMDETQELHNRAKELTKEKGFYTRPPQIPKPEQIDFVKKQSFLAGWFGDRRPLLGIEIANLVYNAKRNALGQALITGFSQVAKSKEVRRYFERGREIAGKHFEIFTSLLQEDYSSAGVLNLTSDVTDSKIAPFSDKLMMYHIAALIASGIGQYGVAMASSPRHDLGVHYGRLTTEIGHYADDGANIMINNGWMEQPPVAADRKVLAK
jgi:spore coat protein CotF